MRSAEPGSNGRRAVAALHHPNICTIHDVGHDQGIDFLVMELVNGESLAARLSKGPLPLDAALARAIEIADALDSAHRQGIIHRDLKPGNIMLASSGSAPLTAKLLDFGLARIAPTGVEAGSAGQPTTDDGSGRPARHRPAWLQSRSKAGPRTHAPTSSRSARSSTKC